ncbi:hypothetical protein [Antrihabitans sp. YC2-6]|uniref:Rv1733c family protein n=1 Tax=Antrihabitans sp. YC2-6 TaxID=2799498 RepID=UPI0018F2D47E|nr:hypothetical protein [Antrihabitans sp. YC2-6]MBJ8346974.1 hypothetical protein [Antrihabitans sp. YC2-6]
MTNTTNWGARLWQLGPWNTNKLMRTSERVYTTAVLIAVVVLAVAVPICATIGTNSYSNKRDSILADRATKHEVWASVVDAVKSTGPSNLRSGATASDMTKVEVEWTVGGRVVRATQRINGHVETGDQVAVWTNDAGERVDPPLPTSAAASFGIWSAITSFSVIAATLIASIGGFRWALDTRNSRRWTHEWADWSESTRASDRN